MKQVIFSMGLNEPGGVASSTCLRIFFLFFKIISVLTIYLTMWPWRPFGDGSCPMCGIVNEKADHFLVECSFAKSVWWLVCRWLNVPIPNTFSLVDLILKYGLNLDLDLKRKRIVYAICWCTCDESSKDESSKDESSKDCLDPSMSSKDKPSMDVDEPRRISSFEVYVDLSIGFRSIDDLSISLSDPSISLSDPSTRRSVLGIYTHVMCSLHF
ncbi:hypothetical protein HanPSC8_Chr03g0113551 [Helianthus annuus]|nr:hypothetical protein HanPSC8_Chr03g0113551 [Helianthus annuus]